MRSQSRIFLVVLLLGLILSLMPAPLNPTSDVAAAESFVVKDTGLGTSRSVAWYPWTTTDWHYAALAGNESLMYAKSTDGGDTWTHYEVRTNVQAASPDCSSPDQQLHNSVDMAVVGPNEIHIAYLERKNVVACDGDYYLNVTYTEDGGQTWQNHNFLTFNRPPSDNGMPTGVSIAPHANGWLGAFQRFGADSEFIGYDNSTDTFSQSGTQTLNAEDATGGVEAWTASVMNSLGPSDEAWVAESIRNGGNWDCFVFHTTTGASGFTTSVTIEGGGTTYGHCGYQSRDVGFSHSTGDTDDGVIFINIWGPGGPFSDPSFDTGDTLVTNDGWSSHTEQNDVTSNEAGDAWEIEALNDITFVGAYRPGGTLWLVKTLDGGATFTEQDTGITVTGDSAKDLDLERYDTTGYGIATTNGDVVLVSSTNLVVNIPLEQSDTRFTNAQAVRTSYDAIDWNTWVRDIGASSGDGVAFRYGTELGFEIQENMCVDAGITSGQNVHGLAVTKDASGRPVWPCEEVGGDNHLIMKVDQSGGEVGQMNVLTTPDPIHFVIDSETLNTVAWAVPELNTVSVDDVSNLDPTWAKTFSGVNWVDIDHHPDVTSRLVCATGSSGTRCWTASGGSLVSRADGVTGDFVQVYNNTVWVGDSSGITRLNRQLTVQQTGTDGVFTDMRISKGGSLIVSIDSDGDSVAAFNATTLTLEATSSGSDVSGTLRSVDWGMDGVSIYGVDATTIYRWNISAVPDLSDEVTQEQTELGIVNLTDDTTEEGDVQPDPTPGEDSQLFDLPSLADALGTTNTGAGLMIGALWILVGAGVMMGISGGSGFAAMIGGIGGAALATVFGLIPNWFFILVFGMVAALLITYFTRGNG